MKEFFDKYGHGQSEEPYKAVKLIIEKLYNVKEKVERGDKNVIGDLSEISIMLDDFARCAKNVEFKPRQFKGAEYQPHQFNPNQQMYPNEAYAMPYRDAGKIGYHWPNVYPLYPFFDRGGKGNMPSNDYISPRDYEREREEERYYGQGRSSGNPNKQR